MILVDTTIWVDHLRRGDQGLVSLLEDGQVVSHPFIISELALGDPRHRDRLLAHLSEPPRAIVAGNAEVLHFIQQDRLFGIGIGYVDAHLLAATRLTQDASVWTRDKRLSAAAERLSLASRLAH
jgi:predicted nucleic acid-binding protein